jgi:hypothetical protein
MILRAQNFQPAVTGVTHFHNGVTQKICFSFWCHINIENTRFRLSSSRTRPPVSDTSSSSVPTFIHLSLHLSCPPAKIHHDYRLGATPPLTSIVVQNSAEAFLSTPTSLHLDRSPGDTYQVTASPCPLAATAAFHIQRFLVTSL